MMILGEQLAGLGQALGDHVEDRLAGGVRQVLGQHADLEPRRTPDAAAVGLDLAVDQLEQGRLAGAVAAHQRQPLAFLQDQIGAVEQYVVAIGELQLFQS